MLLGRCVQLAPDHTATRSHPPMLCVDDDLLHGREVDDEPTVADGVPSDIVAASSDGYGHASSSGELHAPHDISHRCAAGDSSGTPIDHPIPHPAGLIIRCVGRLDEVPEEPGFQFPQVAHGNDALLPGPVW